MKRFLCALAVLALALPATIARAEMVLDLKIIPVKPKPEDETIKVDFTFRNTGKKPVKILGLESACSCLSAELDRAVYEPGSSGTGKAEFKVTSFVGKHEKVVTATTDDPAQPEWVIPFELEVPEVISIEPRTLQWWVGGEDDAKQMTVKVLSEAPIKVTNVIAMREGVDLSWKEVTPGREYTVTVKPRSTAEVILGAVKIETDSSIPKYQRQLGYFSVFRKPAGQK